MISLREQEQANVQVQEQPKSQPTQPSPSEPIIPATNSSKRFAIQLMASVKRIPTTDPELKSLRGKVWILEGTSALKYKYCYGDFADKATAQTHIESIRKEFPQAFIISYDKQ